MATDGVTASSPASVPEISNVEFVDTPPVQPVQRRVSDLGKPTTTATPEVARQLQPLDEGTTPELPAEQQTEQAEQAEQPAEIDYKARYEALLSSRRIPEEMLDQMVEIPNGKDDPIVMMWRDIPGAVLRHKDYTQKTTEVAQLRKQVEQTQNAQRGWVQALAVGSPEQRLQALRMVLPEQGVKELLKAYVESESQLLSMPPEMQELYRQNQAAADRAAALERKLAQIEQQRQMQYQEQVQQEGINAPSIQIVLKTVEQKLPQVLAKYGLEGNETAYDTAINMLIRAVDGQRGADGRWTIQPGIPPTDEQIEYAVSVAREELTMLAQRFVGRAPSQAPPVARGTGPALPAGAPGNPGQQQPKRFSDLGRR